MTIRTTKKIFSRILMLSVVCFMLTACEDTQSYSDLLNIQEKAVNWFLADRKVELEIPADSISFMTGEDAPFYKLDEDGSVYMQVISKGKLDDKVKDGDLVYFRFMRKNIRSMYEGLDPEWVGNADNLNTSDSYFVYGNSVLNTSVMYGQGIQWPLRYLGYDCEVNIVVKSLEGFSEDETTCLPFLINIRYFRPEY